MIILNKLLNSSILPIDTTLTNTNNPGKSGPESKGNDKVLHISQSFRTGVLSFSIVPRLLVGWGVFPFCRGVIGVFFSPS